MTKNTAPVRHVVLTVNGVEGACAAAAVLMAHPGARIQITSPRHLPKAMELIAAESFAGTVHVCGVGISLPANDLNMGVSALARHAKLVWYGGAGHPELHAQAKALSKHVALHLSDAATDTEAITRQLRVKDMARVLLLTELAEEAARERVPRSELHRFCHDLVRAANRRFFFFGDDRLNEQAIRYLAGLESKTGELDEMVEQYRRSTDALYPLGASRAMKELRRQIGRLGPVPEPVLVFGPTGSGKEVMAKALHVTSGRPGSFVAVNCAVLGGNPALVEDRLFGHVKGGYTGAAGNAKGAFQEAHEGTLFLDEIGELPPEVQSQLLRVLEEKVVRPVGTMKTDAVDVRIVAATHRDLSRMVSQGTFREDLYYRLNVLAIRIPPLCERPDDMRSIAAHIGQELESRGYTLKLNQADWDALRAYEWPGNVRQFLNILKRAAYLQKPVCEIIEEERTSQQTTEQGGLTELLSLYCPGSLDEVSPAQDVYRSYLRHVLGLFGGNITRTAEALRIAPNTLRKNV
jgi:DNA-binding NtrC family response regulator